MKICICTTPIRSYPTDFPPLGSMAIIQSLRKIGERAEFFNIDYFRHDKTKIEAYFKAHQFDVVGISAVVLTAYAYTKYLAGLIREVSPQTIIVVGGNLAASAEILLRKCAVDFCVVGDGELIIQDLVKAISRPMNYEQLRGVAGICFLDENDKFCFTGYGKRLAAEDIEFPDYGILEADGSLPYFISENIAERVFNYDGTSLKGARVATVVAAKGCVARCTFCHRWEKGYRAIPVDHVIAHIKELIARFKVGHILMADENFGADRKAAWELASKLGELGLKWQAGGVRARTVSPEALAHWKANGCTTVIFGIESGSAKILKVMEKNATVEDNLNALRWTDDAGLFTIIQLVLGMPGETDDTIAETIEFLKKASSTVKGWKGKVPSELMSVNYAQALPGTAFYEFLRGKGLIGNGVDAEEKYLLEISDTDAYQQDHFVNATGLPMLKVLMWRPMILAHLDAHHLQQDAPAAIRLSLFQIFWFYLRLTGYRIYRRLSGQRRWRWSGEIKSSVDTGGYFNIRSGIRLTPLLFNPITRAMFRPLVAMAILAYTAKSPRQAIGMVWEYLVWRMRGTIGPEAPEQSLRKTVAIGKTEKNTADDGGMAPLRAGR